MPCLRFVNKALYGFTCFLLAFRLWSHMDTTLRNCAVFFSLIAGVWLLYVLRDMLTPFVMAVFLWLIIGDFARWIDKKVAFLPYFGSLCVAFLLVLCVLIAIGAVIVETVFDINARLPEYKDRLANLVNPVLLTVSEENWQDIVARFSLDKRLEGFITSFVVGVQNILSNVVIICVYVAFLFVAARNFPAKMQAIFKEPDTYQRVQGIQARVRKNIGEYLKIQTLMSVLMTVLSFTIMSMFGLKNALFWALVIFILNYIPIIGSLLAGLLPTIFALVQLPSVGLVMAMGGLLFAVQFIISNTLQPKLTGNSMNLSPLVIILSLVMWEALWGGVGAFLSAPLSVIVMIVLAQFPTTRWIAILLSAKGEPNLDYVASEVIQADNTA